MLCQAIFIAFSVFFTNYAGATFLSVGCPQFVISEKLCCSEAFQTMLKVYIFVSVFHLFLDKNRKIKSF